MSSNERRVMKDKSSKFIRIDEGLVMRGIEFRCLMNLW